MNLEQEIAERDRINAKIVDSARRRAEISGALELLRQGRARLAFERGAAVATADEKAINRLRKETGQIDLEIEDHELGVQRLDDNLATLRADETRAARRVAVAMMKPALEAERQAASEFDLAVPRFLSSLDKLIAAHRDSAEVAKPLFPGNNFNFEPTLRVVCLFPLLERLRALFPHVLDGQMMRWADSSERVTTQAYIERVQQSRRDAIAREA